jgi:uncharacterized protein (TIGR03437 family)
MTLWAKISGIPSPYAIVSTPVVYDDPLGNARYTRCGGFLVTSPASNSVSLIDPVKAAVKGTVKVGPQPYSAACFGGTAVVSNYGDNSLSVVDLSKFTVTKTIPNVPGSRSYHGVEVHQAYLPNRLDPVGPPQAWVAGTDADVVTVVDLDQSKVVASIPVRKPTAIRCSVCGTFWNSTEYFAVASSGDNRVLGMDAAKLQTVSVFPNIPTPQDVGHSWLGTMASTGANNALVYDLDAPASHSIAVPGAAAIAAVPPSSSVRYPAYYQYLLATSPDSNSVFLLQSYPSWPWQGFTITNAASFSSYSNVAPGSLASIFATTGVSQNFYANSLPLPKTLGGLTLRIGGSLDFNMTSGWVYSPTGVVEAPLLFVGPNQINFQLPPGTATGVSTYVQIARPNGSMLLTSAGFGPSIPGVFSLTMNGQGQGAVLNQDNTVNFGTNPAKRGSVIQIFATGAGETTPALAAGEAAPASGNPLVLTKVQPTLTIGGKNAKVQFSGMAPGFVGLWQINAEVPADVTPGMAVPLVMTAGGHSSNTITIAVQ